MLNNRIVSGIISTTLLLTPTNTVAYANNTVEKVTFNKINDKQQFIMDKNYIDLKEEFRVKQDIINRVNKRFDKIEEQHRIEEEKKRKEKEERDSYNIEFTISHYGASNEENGGYGGISCNGKKLYEGVVASNVYPQGTIIEFINGERVIVADRGGKDFYSYNRLDKYVDTYDNNYLNKLGKYKIKGKVIKE